MAFVNLQDTGIMGELDVSSPSPAFPATPCPSLDTSSPVDEYDTNYQTDSQCDPRPRSRWQHAPLDGCLSCQRIQRTGVPALHDICTCCRNKQSSEGGGNQVVQPTKGHLPLDRDGASGADFTEIAAPPSNTDGTPSISYSEKTCRLIPSLCPDGGLRAWLTVLGAFCTTTATFGFINSVGILQSFLETHQLSNYTSSDIAWIPGLNVFLCLLLGVQVGPLFDRYGPRWLMPAGSVGYVAGLVIMSFLGCDSCGDELRGGGGKRYVSILLTWGVLCGASAALLCTTSLSVVSHWFEKRRGLASGIVFVGSSIGGVSFPLLMRATLPMLGWAWTMRIVAGIVALLVGTGSLLIRGRVKGKKGDGSIDLSCFRDWRLVWTTLGISLIEFVLVGAMGLLPTWVTRRGFGRALSFNVVALTNAGSGVGRLVAGAMSDHVGRFNTAILTLTWATIVIFGVWLPIQHRIWMVYLFGPLFGFGTGSLISMSPVCIGQLCTVDKFGRFYGTSYSVVSIFAFCCIPLSARILQATGPTGLVIVFGGTLVAAIFCFMMARWSCLDYCWQWKVKV